MERKALDTARGLLKSKLRYHIYQRRAEHEGKGGWDTLFKVEEGFIAAHREVWVETVASWRASEPELLDLISRALDEAHASLTRHFDSLPADWLATEIQEWRAGFDPIDLIREGRK